MIEDQRGDPAGLAAVGMHDEIGDLPVQRIPGLQQFRQPRARVGGLQQWAIAVTRGAPQLFVHRGFEIDDEAARAQAGTVFRRQNGPPPVASTMPSRSVRSSIT